MPEFGTGKLVRCEFCRPVCSCNLKSTVPERKVETPRWWVVAYDGLKVHEAPNLESRTLDVLVKGSVLCVDAIEAQTDKKGLTGWARLADSEACFLRESGKAMWVTTTGPCPDNDEIDLELLAPCPEDAFRTYGTCGDEIFDVFDSPVDRAASGKEKLTELLARKERQKKEAAAERDAEDPGSLGAGPEAHNAPPGRTTYDVMPGPARPPAPPPPLTKAKTPAL